MENPGGQKEDTLKKAYRAAYLIAGHIKETLTEEETDELSNWIVESRENMELFAELTDEKNIAASLERYERIKVEEALSDTKKNLVFPKPRKNFRIWTYAIAASIVIALGLFIYSRTTAPKKQDGIIAVNKTDISPGADNAKLTLPNGTIINLATGTDTLISEQAEALRNKGEIVYAATSNSTPEYHSLSVPRKGQYKLVLPDGTKVWLNAESSIKFPTAFIGGERKVFVTGETFFEVAHDKEKPFRAVAGAITVEALGTQFNINAYSNEPGVTAALMEGSVEVSAGNAEELLQPGQQVEWKSGTFLKTTADIAAVSSWKNNLFQFKNTSIDIIMRQAERWYDAEVVYKDKINLHLNATIERDVPVSKLLHLLEATEQVHFKVVGKQIIVSK